MLVKVFSSTYRGIEATLISIEVYITQGIRFFIVGLADNAIRESQQRIEADLSNNGFGWPHFRVVINLAPADIRKEGTHFDLPLAIGILAASNQVSPDKLNEFTLSWESFCKHTREEEGLIKCKMIDKGDSHYEIEMNWSEQFYLNLFTKGEWYNFLHGAINVLGNEAIITQKHIHSA